MDENVHNLVLAPFQEMVEKSRVTVDNANDAEPPTSDEMRKTAQSLVKEGERAMKRIEPLCKKHWEEYGATFVTALKENDEIAVFRTDLNDLLWDFDTFIEVDDFEAEEFAKLQALARKAAKAIYEILMRMKLEHPVVPFMDFDSAGMSRATSLAGQSQAPDVQHVLSSVETPAPVDEVQTEQQPEVAVTSRPTTMSAQAGPDLGYDARLPEAARQQQTGSEGVQHAPLPALEPEPLVPPPKTADQASPEMIPVAPTVNPWDPAARPPVPTEESLLEEVVRRPRQPPIERHRELPWSTVNAFGETDGAGPARLLPDGVATMMRQVEAEQHSWSQGATAEHAVNPQNGPSRDDRNSLPSQRPGEVSLPLASPMTIIQHSGRAASASPGPMTPPTPELPMRSLHRSSVASATTDSFQSQQYDTNSRRDSLVSPINEPPRPPLYGTQDVAASYSRNSITFIPENQAVIGRGRAPYVMDSGLIPIERSEEQPGLMPVVSGDSAEDRQSPLPKREPNCTINVDSSFYLLKGFCDGAKDIIRGGIGVKKVRKGGIGAGNHTVGKCKSCLFELEWTQVEADVNLSPSTNHVNSGIGFRLRFISKSHLPSRTVDEQLYGCLFCVQLGRTTEESDATVFFSQKQLFRHLARHARPLPAVPGLTVIEGEMIPPQFENNYDLHIKEPPLRSLMVGLERELAQMPTGVAVQEFRRTHGAIRAPTDNSPVLQFVAGQKIVGIEYPAKYGGEWAFGWADNVRGAFPVDSVRLEPPSQAEVRRIAAAVGREQGGSGSGLRAMARWRRHPRDSSKDGNKTGVVGWLKFDKGEVIQNISFPYAEHWCWYGTNSRGKSGIFPQSFMEPNTLSQTPAGDKASILSHDSGGGGSSKSGVVSGAFAKISSMRRRAATGEKDRPVSMAGSHSSGETATMQGLSPRSSVY